MWILAALLTLAVIGAVYEALAARSDAQKHPAPGAVLDVDGVRLHIHCAGSGSSTVVLESGLGDSSLVWAEVQHLLADRFRVCSYDRAGIAWSGAGEEWDWQIGMRQLRGLLAAAGQRPPYVLVGHSSGVNYMRLYALLHPEEVAALVLVEPPILAEVTPAMTGLLKGARTGIGALSRLGVIRILGKLNLMHLLSAGSIPPKQLVEAAGFVYGPGSIRAALREIAALPETIQQMNQLSVPGALGSIPVCVVAARPASGAPAALVQGQEAIAALSTRGWIVTAEGSHFIHYDHPELIVRAVQDALEALTQ